MDLAGLTLIRLLSLVSHNETSILLPASEVFDFTRYLGKTCLSGYSIGCGSRAVLNTPAIFAKNFRQKNS